MGHFKIQNITPAEIERSKKQVGERVEEYEKVIADLRKTRDSLTGQPKREDHGDNQPRISFPENDLPIELQDRRALKRGDTSRDTLSLDLSLSTPQAY